MVLKVDQSSEALEGLLKQIAALPPGISDSDLGQSSRIHTSNKFPGDVDAISLGTTL